MSMEIDYMTSDNLQTIKDTLETKLTRTVLFESQSGASSVTFSDSLSNYDVIEVTYGKLEDGSCGYNSIKLKANTGTRYLTEYHLISSTIQFMISAISVSDTGITFSRQGAHINITSSSWSSWASSESNSMLFFKVVGYKRLISGVLTT